MPKSPAAAADESSDLSVLTLDPTNRRQRTDRGRAMIVASLQETGAGRSIVIDERNEVLAGNGVVEAAPEAGIGRVRIIDAAGDELIAVRRSGLTPEQKRALAIYDNRTAELAEWNADQLAADAAEGLALAPWFSEAELAALLGVGESGGTGAGSLAERFGVPPFTVLDARQGYWQDRKRAWLALGIESELGRVLTGSAPAYENNPMDRQRDYKRAAAAAAPGGSPRPAMKVGADGKTRRGNGRGRALKGTEA